MAKYPELYLIGSVLDSSANVILSSGAISERRKPLITACLLWESTEESRKVDIGMSERMQSALKRKRRQEVK